MLKCPLAVRLLRLLQQIQWTFAAAVNCSKFFFAHKFFSSADSIWNAIASRTGCSQWSRSMHPRQTPYLLLIVSFISTSCPDSCRTMRGITQHVRMKNDRLAPSSSYPCCTSVSLAFDFDACKAYANTLLFYLFLLLQSSKAVADTHTHSQTLFFVLTEALGVANNLANSLVQSNACTDFHRKIVVFRFRVCRKKSRYFFLIFRIHSKFTWPFVRTISHWMWATCSAPTENKYFLWMPSSFCSVFFFPIWLKAYDVMRRSFASLSLPKWFSRRFFAKHSWNFRAMYFPFRKLRV